MTLDIIIITQALLEPGTTRGGAVEEINFRIASYLSKWYSVAIVGPFYKKYIKRERVNDRLTIERVFFPAIRTYPPKSKKELYLAVLLPMPIYLILMIIKILPLVKSNPQIFIVHNGPPGFVAAIIAKLFRKKILCFEGTLTPWINANLCECTNNLSLGLIDNLNLWCGKLICNMSDSIVVQSSLIKDSMASQGIDREKIKVIPGGVDISEFSPQLKNIKSDQFFRIGFIGRLSEEKGASMLLDIIRRSEKEIPSAHFLIMGDGPYRDNFRNLSNIEHLGWVPKTDLPLLISKTNLILFFQKALGLAELEAMASAKAIIVSNIGEIPEYIKNIENGILCSPNTDAYIREIKFLINNPKIVQKISIGARNTAIEQFSWNKIAHEWAHLCQKILAKKSHVQ